MDVSEPEQRVKVADILPKYNPALVEQAVLEEAVELHSRCLRIGEVILRIVANSNDSREVEIATQAISNLKRSGLLRGDDESELVKPTQAALRAYALLLG